MSVFSFRDTGEPVTVLRDHEEVLGGDGEGIFECHDLFVLEEDFSRDFTLHDLVENSNFFGLCDLRFFLFAFHL